MNENVIHTTQRKYEKLDPTNDAFLFDRIFLFSVAFRNKPLNQMLQLQLNSAKNCH